MGDGGDLTSGSANASPIALSPGAERADGSPARFWSEAGASFGSTGAPSAAGSSVGLEAAAAAGGRAAEAAWSAFTRVAAMTPGGPDASDFIKIALGRHAERAETDMKAAARDLFTQSRAIASRAGRHAPLEAFFEYAVDASQRALLTLDVLRRRGDIFLSHEAAGAPPVLMYDYELVVDGSDLARPCNYMLLRIQPPAGAPPVFSWKRPYMIIDPRAGHGAGIGGFKADSQVGVALADGHPVYFVAFKPTPAPGQTLADVTHAEAAFLREVKRRHPEAPEPIVVGNCQGGWATAILAARNPDLVGPIVLNGSPMSYWAGRLGQDPMRYSGGVVGGVPLVLALSDLGGGLFDGANLVMNFEALNPGRNWFRKYFDLYSDVDRGAERFLEFERWWGGFYFMTGGEIRWILENLFVGNRLGANEARLETGRPIDLKAIRAPIIVFASHGDNITPPQQALNWIVDTYADESEIEIRGQRIVYMVHQEVGHLGIFVSSSVARREHAQMASTLKTIEALAPGLYEMEIADSRGEGVERTFTVDFKKRKMSDILALDDGRGEEAAFAAVARLSETLAETYDVALSPALRAIGEAGLGEVSRAMHPLRVQRRMFASSAPTAAWIAPAAARVREHRRPAAPDNPFLLAEKLWADWIEMGWNTLRAGRAAAMEAAFLALYANPFALAYGAPRAGRRARKATGELRGLPEVQDALSAIKEGGVAEGVVRMLVLLADARGDVRRDRLERSSEVLSSRAPFAELAPAARTAMIHRQTLIAHFEPEAALEALPILLPTPEKRAEALALVRYIVGAEEEMEPRSHARLRAFSTLLQA